MKQIVLRKLGNHKTKRIKLCPLLGTMTIESRNARNSKSFKTQILCEDNCLLLIFALVNQSYVKVD